jgi:hypothetical protein
MAYYYKHHDLMLSRKKINQSKARIRNRKFLLEYLKSHPCIDCGERNPIVLEFDHKATHKKEYTIANMTGSSYSLEKIKAEVSKCDVRCANCHRIKTANDLNWFKIG